MKKTFLTLAFVLSISITASFAAESKPVVSETKTIVYSLQSESKSLDDLIDDITIVYNYSSCGTVNIMVYEGPVSDEEILADAESFDEEDCG